MKNIGIWIDKRIAKVISFDDENTKLHTIVSGIEDFNVKGGSGSKFKGGPQDVVQDSKFLERGKHQLEEYFKTIVSFISNADSIVIIGPAQTGRKLFETINKKYPQIKKKLKNYVKTDSMTENQMIAWVRDFYMQVS